MALQDIVSSRDLHELMVYTCENMELLNNCIYEKHEVRCLEAVFLACNIVHACFWLDALLNVFCSFSFF